MNQVVPLRPETVPANLEAEMGLLGALMGNNGLIDRVPSLKGEHFADPRHGEIFEVCRALINSGRGANPVLLHDHLKSAGLLADLGGSGYLTELLQQSMPGSFVTDYAKTIKDRYDRRQTIENAERLIAAARAVDIERSFSEDVAEFIAAMDEIGVENRVQLLTRRQVLESVLKRLEKPQPCYSTGLPPLDAVMEGGIHQGRLYGIAARMKVGKTSLLATIAHALDRQGIPHLFTCHEASPEEIEYKRTAYDMRFNSRAFYRADTRDDPTFHAKIAEYLARACANTIYAAMPGATFSDLRDRINSAVRRNGVKAVLVDYLQLIRGKRRDQSDASHLDEVSQWLADMARKRGLAIVVAAQINQDNGNIRGGEGLRLACDMTLELKLNDAHRAWLEMWESRYTPRQDVGREESPPLILATAAGPLFEEIN